MITNLVVAMLEIKYQRRIVHVNQVIIMTMRIMFYNNAKVLNDYFIMLACAYLCKYCLFKADFCYECDEKSLRKLNLITSKCDCPNFYTDIEG